MAYARSSMLLREQLHPNQEPYASSSAPGSLAYCLHPGLSLTGALYAGLQMHPASQMLFVAVTWSRKVVALKVGYNILSELATGGIDFKNGAFQLTEDGEKVNLTEQLQKQAEEKQQKLADIVEQIEMTQFRSFRCTGGPARIKDNRRIIGHCLMNIHLI